MQQTAIDIHAVTESREACSTPFDKSSWLAPKPPRVTSPRGVHYQGFQVQR